jgi:hypothetical protein
MTDIREAMPVLARHLGQWVGEYIHLDPYGSVVDRHKSHLSCQIVEGPPQAYHQINTYEWADGREEILQFPAVFRDGRLWFDTERIYGWVADGAQDPFHRTGLLEWTRKDMPDSYLYEMIQLNDNGRTRARVWQWFVGDRLTRRTIINETKID